ncbi:TauD/TfdA family dioxygenase [Candidatus Laterigemmans baculatus]|uniref:TauD/TfdA family dioxygenase n=1 Tax=Candidatus Laterigemmans baculatus TaxID=2770505 RepID=UPI0013DC83C9|nr:TauD/TfdA family dioxygenase [Candidatus Laterigemmans baculatus]
MPAEALDVEAVSVRGQQKHGGEPFPLVLRCASPAAKLDQTVDWLAAHASDFEQKADRHGAILFRGFPVQSPEDFDRFIAAFGWENFPYEQSLSNAVRKNYTPRVFSANEAPADVTIYLHHEMAQTPVFPSKLFFYCQQPAESGGATPLCRSDVLFEQMLARCPDFARDCEHKGLRYTNVMPAEDDAASGMGRSWQSTFRANRREEAEQRLHGLGYSWEWSDDGCLRATTPVLPAVREVGPGRKTFFNQLIAAFRGWKDSRNDPGKAITFGDGTPLDRDTVLTVAEMAEQLTYDHAWQQGDVVLVDNYVAMHGRRTFSGSRRILASLVAAEHHGAELHGTEHHGAEHHGAS